MAGTSSTKLYTVQDAINAVLGTNGQVADLNPAGLMDMGRYVATPTAVADGQYVTVLANKIGYRIPDRQSVLVGSLNGAVATTTAVLGTMLNLGAFKELDILVNVTATGGSTSTLTIYVDSRLDGTTYSNIAAGATMTTASTQVIHLSKSQTAGTAILVTAVAGVGTIRPIGWADDIQVRYTLTGATSTFDFRVFLNGVG